MPDNLRRIISDPSTTRKTGWGIPFPNNRKDGQREEDFDCEIQLDPPMKIPPPTMQAKKKTKRKKKDC